MNFGEVRFKLFCIMPNLKKIADLDDGWRVEAHVQVLTSQNIESQLVYPAMCEEEEKGVASALARTLHLTIQFGNHAFFKSCDLLISEAIDSLYTAFIRI